MKDVEGKTAVVTGAASGIGLGMAQSFADAGMRVVLSDLQEAELSRSTAALRDSGADVHSIVCDVSKPEQVQSLADGTLERYGAVHVLCNNAGIGVGGVPTWESTLDDWEWILGVNLMGVIHGVRTFLPILLEQGDGHIVNTASLAGLITGPDNALYGVTKFGVVALSEHVYLELKRSGAAVSASVLCPGYVDTNILKNSEIRPAEFPDAAPPAEGPVVDIFREWFTEQLAQGLSPREVGDQVLSAIREDRFYILTHPDWSYLIEHRLKTILSGQNPTPMPPPGFQSLLTRLQAAGIELPAASPGSQ